MRRVGKAGRRHEAGQDRVHLDARPVERRAERPGECHLRVLRGGVGRCGREDDGTADRGDRCNVCFPVLVPRPAEAREEPACDPDAAEVVDRERALDLVERRLDEGAADENSGAVDEQVDRWMALEDVFGRRGHRAAVTHVAGLDLPTRLLGNALEDIRAAGEEHAVPAGGGELPRRRFADPGRRARDHGNPAPRWCPAHTLSLNALLFSRPRAPSLAASPGTSP